MYLKRINDSNYADFLNELNDVIGNGGSITDTHSHIHFEDYSGVLDAILQRARNNGVKKIITIGINYNDSLSAQRLASQYREIYFAAGIHPSEVETFNDKKIFETLFSDKKCVAIGEIGLDFFRNSTNRKLQEYVFTEFLTMSVYLQKPIIIHTREATAEILPILNDFAKHNELKGVFHCFSGDEKLLDWGLEHNFYFSFTGNITFAKSDKLRELLKIIPTNRMLLETDCPYLTPMPFRGKKNESAYVIFTLYTAYKMTKMTLQEFVILLENNVKNIFGI